MNSLAPVIVISALKEKNARLVIVENPIGKYHAGGSSKFLSCGMLD